MQLCHTANRQRRQGRSAARNIKAKRARAIDTQRPNGVERAIVRRILDYQDIQIRIDAIQRRGGRARKVIGLGYPDNIWVGSRIQIACGVGECAIRPSERSIIGIEPQILVSIADHADAIRH
jgi:hypothetical protein